MLDSMDGWMNEWEWRMIRTYCAYLAGCLVLGACETEEEAAGWYQTNWTAGAGVDDMNRGKEHMMVWCGMQCTSSDHHHNINRKSQPGAVHCRANLWAYYT